jgi:mannosyltransferase OCH1-like enzyme
MTPNIPRAIHRIWIDPNDPERPSAPPPDVHENIASWMGAYPDWRQTTWTYAGLLRIAQAYHRPDVGKAMTACAFPAMIADLGRLLLLHIFGGVWVDLKVGLLERPPVFEDPNQTLILTEHWPQPNLPIPNGRITNSVIAACGGHPIIKAALLRAAYNVNSRLDASIYHVTGATNLDVETAKYRFRNPSIQIQIIPHQLAWGTYFEIRGGSYNGERNHWSLREQREPIYRDMMT